MKNLILKSKKLATFLMLFGTIVLSQMIVSSCSKEKEIAKETNIDKSATSESNKIELTNDEIKINNVVLDTIQSKNISGVLKVTGKIDVPPENNNIISSPYSGIIKKANLVPGMSVSKGQVLTIIENPEFINIQQEYMETLAKLQYQELEVKRQNELQKANANANKTTEAALSELNLLKAKINGLTAKLDLVGIRLEDVKNGKIKSYIEIKSPINGVISFANANPGKYVQSNDMIYQILDKSHLHAELKVFEKDITHIQVKQKIELSTLTEPKSNFPSWVKLISKNAENDATFSVHAEIDDKDAKNALYPGMFVEAFIDIDSKQSSALPEEAVVRYEGKRYVFVYTNENGKHTYQMIEIAVGLNENGFVEVIVPSNITSSSKIVVKGANSILSKMKNAE